MRIREALRSFLSTALIRVLLRFGATGGLSVGIDFIVLISLHDAWHMPLIPSASVAYFASLLVNYGLNHAWVFQSSGDHGRRLLRYGALVVLNYTLTIVIVSGLASIGLYYLLAKAAVVVLNGVLNFTLFRAWVFATDPA